MLDATALAASPGTGGFGRVSGDIVRTVIHTTEVTASALTLTLQSALPPHHTNTTSATLNAFATVVTSTNVRAFTCSRSIIKRLDALRLLSECWTAAVRVLCLLRGVTLHRSISPVLRHLAVVFSLRDSHCKLEDYASFLRSHLLEQLPSSFDSHFAFDAAVLHVIRRARRS
jgi:hypothetical protein